MTIKITNVILAVALVGTFTGCGTMSGNSDEANSVEATSSEVSANNNETADKPTPLMLAAAEGDLAELQDLIGSGSNVNTQTPEGTALTYAVDKNQQISALYLMSVGANPNKGFNAGETSLLMKASERADNRVVKAMLAAGAEVNYADSEGQSAIALASYKGHLTTVKTLLKAGADVNVTPEGKSLLMHIVKNNDLLLAQVVIAAGADVNYSDESGTTALKIAQENGLSDLEMLLVQSGANS
ncbi:ankyrin repeat domain-containing protein [Alkalimarinus sediminis]|uniref:Ankyrin repeat domain-containing protein n=1 Tax=Alkalimarinus sediminis TaxID=1632866 RepID=A0A9E8HGZ2_9ALTE|nr:ankyrin repeat domain-containing protein [Alkalimarinus sediminis]UZW74488.1 ankyrin repeat domain-containing protein [Alkalimarinus sediminis]